MLRSAVPAASAAAIKRHLAERYESLGAPLTYARPPLEPAPDVEISVVGLIFHHLGRHVGPDHGDCVADVAPFIIPPICLAVCREALGSAVHLEYTSAVLNHGERPFFKWHMHVGGVDNVRFRKQKLFPRFKRLERLTTLLYLDDLDEAVGRLVVKPRHLEEPTEPPQDPLSPNWQGQVELSLRRGDVVVLDQCTWHAARPKTSAGLRGFVACFVTAEHAPAASYVDRSFAGCGDVAPHLASLIPSEPVRPGG